MTDLEKFVQLYKEFGIDLKVNQVPNKHEHGCYAGYYEVYLSPERTFYTDIDGVFTVSEKFEGFNGFYSLIWFDLNGKFVRQGFWE